MILEIATIYCVPGKQKEFEEAIERGLRTVHTRAQGMRGYKLNRCVETPDRYVLEVRWDSVDDHMVKYRESPLSPEFRAIVSHFFAKPVEYQHYEPLFQGEGAKS